MSNVETIISAIDRLSPQEMLEVLGHLDKDVQVETMSLYILEKRVDIAINLDTLVHEDGSKYYSKDDLKDLIGLEHTK